MCKDMTEALLENVIEITWMFDSLEHSGEIKSWDDLIDEFYGSNGIKAEIIAIANSNHTVISPIFSSIYTS